jgi:hypothetical protein
MSNPPAKTSTRRHKKIDFFWCPARRALFRLVAVSEVLVLILCETCHPRICCFLCVCRAVLGVSLLVGSPHLRKKIKSQVSGVEYWLGLVTYVVTEEAVADQLSGVASHHGGGGGSVVGRLRLVDKGRTSGVSSAVCDEDHGAGDTSFAVGRRGDQPLDSLWETQAQRTCKNRCYLKS